MAAWHALEIDDVERELDASLEGLTADEVERRREKYGPNVIEEEAPINLLGLLLHQFKSPLIYILIIAAVIAAAIGEVVDSMVIAFVLLLNAVIGFTQEYRAETAARALQEMVSPKAKAKRDGEKMDIPSEELVPGDLVFLETGERVAADMRLARTRALEIDEALMTGESSAVTKSADSVPEDTMLADRTNMAYAGCIVTRGRGRGYVVATAHDTELGKIFGHVRMEGLTETPLQKRLEHFAKVVGIVVLIASLAAVAVGVVMGEALSEVFLIAVALAVSAIPEGLPVVFTVALAVGVQRMAKRNAIVRRLPAVETLGSTTVIGSDKTGTLTENRMIVEKLWVAGEMYDIEDEPSPEYNPSLHLLLSAGVLTNEATVMKKDDGDYDSSGDPTEVALLVAGDTLGVSPVELRSEYKSIAELPFESDKQYSASYRKSKLENRIFVKGAPEKILDLSTRMVSAHGEKDLDEKAVKDAARRMAEEGLRVLAMAYAEDRDPGDTSDPEEPDNLVFIGLQGMKDPPREGVREAVHGCQEAGIRVLMITGDHEQTARAIGREVGIGGDDPRTATGRDLAMMNKDELVEAVNEISIYARVSPEQKLSIVRSLRGQNEIVCITGDGVNDAPALKAAAIGVAMGESGTDVAHEASDIILTDDNFKSIFEAVKEGRVIFDNLRKATFFLLSTGAAAIIAILATQILGWPLPLLPAQLLWLNLVTNGLQDVALAFEPGEPDIEKRPPRDPDEGVMSALLWERTAIVGIVMAIGTLWLFRTTLDSTGDITIAQTAALTTMVIFQMFHVWNARSSDRSVFRLNPFSNPFLFVAVIASVSVHIFAMYFAPLQFVLRIEPLPAEMWMRMVLAALSIILVVEVHKWFRRKTDNPSGDQPE